MWAKRAQEALGGEMVKVINNPNKPWHYAVKLPDGRIVDPSYLGNYRAYAGQVPDDILKLVGENDTFSPELYEVLRSKLEAAMKPLIK